MLLRFKWELYLSISTLTIFLYLSVSTNHTDYIFLNNRNFYFINAFSVLGYGYKSKRKI